jgi:hypothetical protein
MATVSVDVACLRRLQEDTRKEERIRRKVEGGRWRENTFSITFLICMVIIYKL